MNRAYMRARTLFLRTAIGKKIRYNKQIKSYKRANAEKIVNEFFGGLNDNEKASLVDDMMNEALKYNVGFDEYVMYHFESKSQEERRQFVPTRERAIYCERMNDPKNQMLFDDKGKTFEVFGKYFKRDLVSVVGKKCKNDFAEFAEKHNRFIIKPFNGGNGRGIRIVDSAEYKSIDEMYDSLVKEHSDGFVAEELIIQCEELAAVHPESVNTMRIFTILLDDGTIEYLPFAWRVGRGSSCVDNGGSGGIFCALNDEGVIVSTADEKGRFYEVHPDTNHALIGFKIPRFEEAKALAAELAKVVPTNRYCGWDLALTEDGWVMQEGNWQGGVVAFQCPMQKGCRNRLDEIVKKLGV